MVFVVAGIFKREKTYVVSINLLVLVLGAGR